MTEHVLFISRPVIIHAVLFSLLHSSSSNQIQLINILDTTINLKACTLMSKPQDKTLPGFCGAKIVKSGRTAASNKQHRSSHRESSIRKLGFDLYIYIYNREYKHRELNRSETTSRDIQMRLRTFCFSTEKSMATAYSKDSKICKRNNRFSLGREEGREKKGRETEIES